MASAASADGDLPAVDLRDALSKLIEGGSLSFSEAYGAANSIANGEFWMYSGLATKCMVW